jgi:Arc/MetJ-type ribon-helix-helix transcriptional regulator
MKSQAKPTSIRLAPADLADLEYLVDRGIFTSQSDAVRAALRKGVEQIKKERGFHGKNG